MWNQPLNCMLQCGPPGQITQEICWITLQEKTWRGCCSPLQKALSGSQNSRWWKMRNAGWKITSKLFFDFRRVDTRIFLRRRNILCCNKVHLKFGLSFKRYLLIPRRLMPVPWDWGVQSLLQFYDSHFSTMIIHHRDWRIASRRVL